MSTRKRGNPSYEAMFGPFANNPAGNALGLAERMYIRILTELSANRFKWVGLPSSVDERFLELALFNQALAVFYFDEQFGRYLCLRATSTGRVNMYDNPTEFTVNGNGSPPINKVLKAGNTWEDVIGDDGKPVIGPSGFPMQKQVAAQCVPIWGNFLRIPDKDIIYVYAKRLATIDTTFDINMLAMRLTHVMTVPEDKRLTAQNLFRQHQQGQPVIFGVDGLNLEDMIKVWPVMPDKDIPLNIQISKSRVWNECMTLLGINNANQDKKERVVSNEVESNDEQVVSNRGIALNSRRMAVKQIRERYKLSLDVGWNPEVGAMAGEYAILAGVEPLPDDTQEVVPDDEEVKDDA